MRKGSKFILMMESDSEEEIGHEFFALRDLQQLGVKQFNTSHDVFDESKQLIIIQSNLLDQSKFMGFLGYCILMEFLFAKYIDFQLKLLIEQEFLEKHKLSYIITLL